MKKKYHCKDCKKEISKNGKRCKSCAFKGKNNPMYIDGRRNRGKKCIDCRKKIYLYSKSRCRSCENKRRWKEKILKSKLGKDNPNYKSGKPKCINCCKQLKYYNTKRCEHCHIIQLKEHPPLKGRKFPNRLPYICNNKGKLNPNWKGGVSKLPYPFEFNDKLKEKIRKRDNYTCQNCGIIEEEHIIIQGKNLTIHHIDYNKMNCKETNLITLCSQCNSRANGDRNYWKKYYKNLLIIGGINYAYNTYNRS
ncbi:hypothetical protein LCGC14_2630560 [marine sediment metagenome]|uniref:HNH nuclease domain-containing protein n=1 Tax=marine sediment metagenome TaxID=412755 RepID=A0A0F9AN04_9ZZZZ